jgi:hypothetical protein
MDIMKTKLTNLEYYSAMGILEVIHNREKVTKLIINELQELLEVSEVEDRAGWISDAVYGNDDIDALLSHLSIEVDKHGSKS